MRQSQLGWSQVKIGLLVVVALSILAYMILNLEEGMGLIQHKTKFRALVPHTQGLKIGGPVRMNGVDIGNIHGIAISGETAQVEIKFTVQQAAAIHIRQDAAIHIRALGLLGDKFLEIAPGSPNQPPLPPNSVIVGQPETDMTDLAATASVTIEKVNAALEQIQLALKAITQGQGTTGKLVNDPELFDRSKEVLGKIDRASDKGLALLEKVEKGEGTVGKLMTDKDLYARAATAVRELQELTKKLNNQNGTLAKLADPDLYNKLDRLSNRGETLLAKIEHGEGTVGKLVTNDELYVRTDKLLTEIEQFVAEVKKNPKKYLKLSVF
ncbi:MAG: MCE family protein [Nitrospiraceae bacterium]|nr:MCE family protein [Nitrospiraceae bacterium]